MRARSFATWVAGFGMTAGAWVAAPVAAGPVLPDFDAANFAPGPPAGDHPYFPLVPLTLSRLREVVVDPDTGETEVESVESLVTTDTEQIAGVTARVVHEREFTDGLLSEDTFDWFAQDKLGNVWYMGEDTTNFEYDDEGNLIGTDKEGSWRAGVDGAKPGFIMPAFPPEIGFSYFQEFAPNAEALDQAVIISLDETITVPAGTFSDVLQTQETTELEPDDVENDYYARGIGPILEQEVDPQTGVPLGDGLRLQSVTVIPLPPAVVPGIMGVLAVAGWYGRPRRYCR